MEGIAKSALVFIAVLLLKSILWVLAFKVGCLTSINLRGSPTADELPVCIGNLVDKRQTGSYYGSSRLMTRSGSCQLLNYTTERIVDCLDTLAIQHAANPQLHLLFMGDSRIRQQFLNFIRVLPDYDIRFQPSRAARIFRGNMEMTSQLLGLRVSFIWQPFVNDQVKKQIFQWTNSAAIRRPYFILLSMALWHMFDVKDGDLRRYQKKLTELSPVLTKLSNVTRVIWLNQYPTTEFYGHKISDNKKIHSEKINAYNLAVRRILVENHNDTKVQIWDSGNQLVEEYIRSCGILQRYDVKKTSANLLQLKYYSSPYRNCNDFIHTGYSALSQNTQLLYNHICSASLYNRY